MSKCIRVSCLLVLLLALAVWAQQDMGYITGRVVDASGLVVPDATITVLERQTGDRTVTRSTPTGNYTAGPLKIGTYQVMVEQDGFKRALVDDVAVHAQSRVRVNFTLKLGQVAETISVEARAPLLETENASLGRAIETRAIRQLPLSGRNFQQLALLTAGVIPAIGHRDWAGGFNAHG